MLDKRLQADLYKRNTTNFSSARLFYSSARFFLYITNIHVTSILGLVSGLVNKIPTRVYPKLLRATIFYYIRSKAAYQALAIKRGILPRLQAQALELNKSIKRALNACLQAD